MTVSGRPDIELTVLGEPKGKGRPKFNRHTGSAYTPTPTIRAEQRIQTEWIHAGRPRLEGAVSLTIEIVLARPKGHWKTDGSLSAPGSRSPLPLKTPDADNALKLVCDALNGLAYDDDRQIVDMHARKRWARLGEHEHTRIELRQVAVEIAA